MLRLVAACVVLALAVGQEHHCCAPDIWEGELHSAAGYVTTGTFDPKYVHQRDFLIYDYVAKMSSYSHHSYYEDGTDRSFRLLFHFNTKTGYFIEAGECRLFELTSEMQRFCVESNATVLPPIFYGMGDHTLSAVRYYERIMNGERDVGAKIVTFSQHGCIPIETVEYEEEASHGGTGTIDIVRGGTWANIVPEVTDREELEPPATCPEGLMPEELKHNPNFQIFWNHITK